VAPAVGGREDDDGAALEDEKAFGAAAPADAKQRAAAWSDVAVPPLRLPSVSRQLYLQATLAPHPSSPHIASPCNGQKDLGDAAAV